MIRELYNLKKKNKLYVLKPLGNISDIQILFYLEHIVTFNIIY